MSTGPNNALRPAMRASSIPDRLRRFAERNAGSRSASAAGKRVCLEQTGTMCQKPGAAWRPFSATQWMAVDEVAFCWRARATMAPLVTATVVDAYEHGRGRLEVKLWGTLPVVRASGAEIDRGEVQRYLAELPWNPEAILANRALRFDVGPDGATRVWVGGPETYVDLHFDREGDIVRTYSETRARGDDGVAPWEGRFERYDRIGGVRVPMQGEVAWHLPSGRFPYWRGELTAYRIE